jgi:hypothetical protein
MRIRSGSCSSSSREVMHGFVFCSEMEKTVLRMVAGPVSHGSRRMVKDPGNKPGEDTGAAGGEKVRRKAVSPFSDCTVKDMAARSRRGQGRGQR